MLTPRASHTHAGNNTDDAENACPSSPPPAYTEAATFAETKLGSEDATAIATATFSLPTTDSQNASYDDSMMMSGAANQTGGNTDPVAKDKHALAVESHQ